MCIRDRVQIQDTADELIQHLRAYGGVAMAGIDGVKIKVHPLQTAKGLQEYRKGQGLVEASYIPDGMAVDAVPPKETAKFWTVQSYRAYGMARHLDGSKGDAPKVQHVVLHQGQMC